MLVKETVMMRFFRLYLALGLLYPLNGIVSGLGSEEANVQARHAEIQAQAQAQEQPRLLTTRAYSDIHADQVKKDISSASSQPKLYKRAKQWTPDEEKRLLELRAQNIPWEELVEHFPGRTWRAIQLKYNRMTRDETAKRATRRAWTAKENKRLLELVEAGKTYEEMTADLPGRTKKAIEAHYNSMKRDGTDTAPKTVLRKFSAEEDRIIIEALRTGKKLREIYELVGGRGKQSVEKRVRRLRESGQIPPASYERRREGRPRPYTAADLERIRGLREEGLTWGTIREEYFPDRSESSLRRRYLEYLEYLESGGREREEGEEGEDGEGDAVEE